MNWIALKGFQFMLSALLLESMSHITERQSENGAYYMTDLDSCPLGVSSRPIVRRCRCKVRR